MLSITFPHVVQGTLHDIIKAQPFVSLSASYQMVSNPVDYVNACNHIWHPDASSLGYTNSIFKVGFVEGLHRYFFQLIYCLVVGEVNEEEADIA